MPTQSKPETNEVQTAQAVDPAAICSLLGDTPVTNAIRACYRGEDNKLGVAMIAHANDMERRLHAIAGSIACLRDEWVTQQSEMFQEFISCIRRNATLTANAKSVATCATGDINGGKDDE